MIMLRSALYIVIIALSLGCATAQPTWASSASDGFKPWAWQASNCQNCEIQITPVDASEFNHDVYTFIHGLTSRKTELLELYQSNGQDYNLLAHMAVGILGQESRFFESERYKIKESLPGLVTLVKKVRSFGSDDDVTVNSRGPTQIKIIPQKIAERYNIKSSDLRDPEKAAIATMGFLIESLKELRTRIRVSKLDYIKEDQIVDYLPYIYFGAAGRLAKHTATPETNIYVKEMKRYMSYFKIYEKPE